MRGPPIFQDIFVASFLYFWTLIVLPLLHCKHHSSAKRFFTCRTRQLAFDISGILYILDLTSSPPSFHTFSPLLVNNAFCMHNECVGCLYLGTSFPKCLHLQLELSFMAFSCKKELPIFMSWMSAGRISTAFGKHRLL